MKTPKSVKLKAESQILVAKKGTQSGFSVETDMHFLSNNVIKNGSARETYPPFADEPKAGKKPEPVKPKPKPQTPKPKEEKKGFSWGKLFKNVVAAVVFTAGTAIPAVVGAIAGLTFAGGMVMGGIGVACKAASDKANGEVSDKASYMATGERESFVGAVSGAIFVPFGAMKALGGKMLFGGVTNGCESVLRQTLEGKGINFKTVLFDAGIGGLTAGVFHGAGKAFHKASPFVKKAFNKVSTKISDNMKAAKIALKNMQRRPKKVTLGMNGGNADEALREFANKFKKAKRLVKPNSKNPMFGDDWNDYFSKRYGKENVDWLTDTSKRAKVNYGDHFEKVNRKKVLKPNIEYVTPEGHKYKINNSGAIDEVEGTLKLGDGKRSLYAQRTAGGDYRLLDDDGGHLIGSQFLGSGKLDNLVHMNSQINRAGGKWYNMETEWANALKEGKDVQVKIQNIYEPNNLRPVSFKIKYTIDGEKTKIIKILNKSGG